MPLHPAWVKNIARRVLWAALESDITKDHRQSMEDFFAGKCAYCDTPLNSRWHADHLLSVDAGGFNHISNRVPACPRCNEHEKRDRQWQEFLAFKCGGDEGVRQTRQARIEEWMNSQKPEDLPVNDANRAAWNREVAALSCAIDAAWRRLRRARSANKRLERTEKRGRSTAAR